MFSICPSVVCPSVRSFVGPLPTCERYIFKKLNQFQCKLVQVVPGARAIAVDLVSQQIAGGRSYIWRHHSRPFESRI